MATLQEPQPTTTDRKPASTFLAEALKLGGKSSDEVRRMGEVDAADDQVEALFAARHQTTHSPIHRAVWEAETPVDLFRSEASLSQTSDAATHVMDASLEVVRRHKRAGTLLDQNRKISAVVMGDLAEAG